MSNNLGNFLEDYNHLLPDLGEIDAFDLNWDHEFMCCSEDYFAANFGVIPLYAIDGTGHDYLVCCPIPNLKVEEYPIAIHGEEEGVAEIIASSIKTWVPNYLTKLMDWDYAPGYVFRIANHKDRIMELFKKFINPAFTKKLEAFLSQKEIKPPTKEELAEFKKLAENSYISEFIELKEKNADFAAWKEYIKKYPFYNKGLYWQFVAPKYNLIERDLSKLKVDAEIAHEVFTRRWTQDFDNTSRIEDIIKVASKIVSKDPSFKGKSFWNLINGIADGSIQIFGACEEIYDEGKALEKSGELIKALICYENAFYMSCCEEGYYAEAFDSIKSVAKKINDSNYLIYLKKIEDGTVSFF